MRTALAEAPMRMLLPLDAASAAAMHKDSSRLVCKISTTRRLSELYYVRSRVRPVSIQMNPKTVPEKADPTIHFENVTYRINGTVQHKIVSNIRVSVAAGQTLLLLGRSGSGKTTLLRLINRLLVPTGGQVIVQGRPTTEWDPIRLRRGIGYVIQDAGLFPHFTVAENIALGPTLEKWADARTTARIHELLTLVALAPAEFPTRKPHELSGGQRQRVGVARALAVDPPILLMDEPFGALDPVTLAELQREFSALARRLGKTIVFVTHDLREALLLPSRIILLEGGRIVADATPQEFSRIDHPEVRAFTASLAPLAGAQA